MESRNNFKTQYIMSFIPLFGFMIVWITCCYKIKVLKNFFSACIFYLRSILVILPFLVEEYLIFHIVKNLALEIRLIILSLTILIMSVCLSIALIELCKYYFEKYLREPNNVV